MKPSKNLSVSLRLVSISTFLFTLTLHRPAAEALEPLGGRPDPPPIQGQLVQQLRIKTTAQPHHQLQLNQTTTSNKPQIQSQAPSPILVEPAAAAAAVAAASSSNPSATTTSTPSTTSTTTAQPPEKTWLESILIQVEGMQHNHQLPVAVLATDHDPAEGEEHAATGTPVSSSLAPTDSGEDPLESTTTLASADAADQVNVSISPSGPSGTQYSITSSSSGSNELATHIDLDEEQRLVDSNNVSAVVALPTREQATATQGADSTVGVRNGEIPVSHTPQPATTRQPLSCDQAYTQCALRKVCAPALKAYNDDCHELISNRTSQCSTRCLKAMIALRSSEEGDDLVNCDCEGNEYCLRSKQRSQACRPQVEQAVDPTTVVSCSTASWICLADQLCSTALDYYYRNCQSLFSQRHCSMRCNNSLSILYRQPKASKLINCHCDGSEEFPCVKYKTYTERLCLNKLAPLTTQTSDNFGDEENYDNFNDNNNNNHEHQQQAPEGEGFNMTNDPETFVLGSDTFGGRGGGGRSGNSGDEEEREDAKAAAGSSGEGGGNDEESTSTGSNGIQLADDNWIPLMSGRYFTNLHQQRMRQQQQELLLQKQTRDKQSLSSSSQAAQRRSSAQKNAKHRNKSNNTNGHYDSRRRYNRILVFASTSSGAQSVRAPPLPPTLWATTCLMVIILLFIL